MAAREARRGTRFATCPLTKSGFGLPTRPGLGPRLEKTQNLVSTNVPEVIESLRASCNGIGMAMTEVVMSAGSGSGVACGRGLLGFGILWKWRFSCRSVADVARVAIGLSTSL